MVAADPKVIIAPEGASLRLSASAAWKNLIDPVEPFLAAVSRQLGKEAEAFDRDLSQYAEYALNGQGKHLRPALVALAANALGKPSESHVTVAVVIEMVHLATLVHDDVMDEAEVRRGRLTLAANWGNDLAVLFGDCLFARALALAAGFPTPEVCRAVAVATNTVCTGEILQTRRRGDFGLTREAYFKILEMKTAELFALSCDLAAFLNGATAEARKALRQFGLAFGTAYQIYDDCVDLFGSEAVAGKSLGTDLAKGKLTLPVLLLWERASAVERKHIRALVEKWEPSAMKTMSEYLRRYQTLPASLAIMRQYLQRGCEVLNHLPATEGRAGLIGLTDFLARQTDALAPVAESGL